MEGRLDRDPAEGGVHVYLLTGHLSVSGNRKPQDEKCWQSDQVIETLPC